VNNDEREVEELVQLLRETAIMPPNAPLRTVTLDEFVAVDEPGAWTATPLSATCCSERRSLFVVSDCVPGAVGRPPPPRRRVRGACFRGPFVPALHPHRALRNV
jgi:hypothetical protein